MGGSGPAWHSDRIHAAIESGATARSALVASWRRSAALHQLDPSERKPPARLGDAETALRRQRVEPLLRAAQASLDRLHSAVGDVGCCVLLADRDGVPVDRRGAASDDATFQKWGLWTGAVWSELAEGTNGIGTCLVESRPVTIHRDQHFFARNAAMSCSTAPIYDHLGELAAAVDVSSCRADLTEAFGKLIAIAVGDAARRIEVDHFRMAFAHSRIALAATPEALPHALVAIDADDRVVGATRAARQALGLDRDRLARGLSASELFGAAADLGSEMRRAERGAIELALARAGGNVAAAARALGVSRATLHRKMNKLGLRAAD